MTHRVVIPFALICGLLAAVATSVRAQSPPTAPATAPVPTTPAVALVPAATMVMPPVAGIEVNPACRQPAPGKPATAKAPSQALFDAFGILRRERTDADAPSRAAREALTRAGVRVHDINAARLLREATGGGRAWVVPVADVTPLLAPFLRCVPVPRRARPAPRRANARRRAARRRPARRVPGPALVEPPLAMPVSPAYGPVPFGPAPLPTYAPALLDGKPQEGLVVVAEGDVPYGVGGTHKQLIRGLVPPAVAQCAGPKRDLVGVSGIVPDGVGAAFLTSADGTAVKADVKDNAYAFLVAPAKGREAWAPRYVVWTGGDGTPHIQPVSIGNVPRSLCRRLARQRRANLVALSPSPRMGEPFGALPGRLWPAPRPGRPPRPRTP